MTSAPRIAFLIRSLAYGGAQRQLILLASGLRAAGWSVSVLVFYPGPLEHELRATGAAVIDLRKRSRWDFAGVLLRLILALRRIRPDVLHTYMTAENVIGAIAKLAVPHMRLVWGIRATDFQASQYGRLYQFALRSQRWLSRVPERIIANAAAGAESLRVARYPQEKVTVVSNGIDVERFRPDRQLGEPLRTAWGFGLDTFVIGTVARFDPMKGYELLIEAASILLREHPDIRFVCVGDSTRLDYFAHLRALAEELGVGNAVRWEQSRADIVAIYNAFDVLTLTSRYGEGISNAVGEAMACGVPCIVTDVGDNAMLVGDTGWVVRGDAHSVVAAWRAALSGSLADRRARARQRIVDRFSVARLVESTDALLRREIRESS